MTLFFAVDVLIAIITALTSSKAIDLCTLDAAGEARKLKATD